MPVTDTQGPALFESWDVGASWTRNEALWKERNRAGSHAPPGPPAEAERPVRGPASPRTA
jgi:hypothetical protein